MTPHLEKLNLHACNEFELHMPVECPKLKYLKLGGSKVCNLNLELTPHLEKLYLTECYCLQQIHAPVGCLKRIVHVILVCCSRFLRFTFNKKYESADLDAVVTSGIDAQCVRICPLHPTNNLPFFSFKCIYGEPGSSWSGNLEKLISSSLCACKNLEYLSATTCGLQHLRELTLGGSIPGDLWQLENLEKLCLSMIEIPHLPDSICMLKHLKSLKLEYIWDVEQLLENICRLECLEELGLTCCGSLRDIPSSICKMKCFKRLRLTYCDQVEKFSEELGCLECLEELVIKGCRYLQDIPSSICKMNCLKRLHLSYCDHVERLPEELGCLECLEELHLTDCIFLRDIPNSSICSMKYLKSLKLSLCIRVEKLSEELGRLECLKELT